MTNFISAALCRGVRPRQVASGLYHSRSELISRLMKERSVTRFIVAPNGFGKTTLAGEYAETVFSYEHVAWIDCKSPCFLRDLDNDSLVDGLCTRDPSLALIVFDDVPLLDSYRADLLSNALDRLLEKGIETIVTLMPACDAYARRHADRILLRSTDLIVTDKELQRTLRLEILMENPPSERSVSERIPINVWGNTESNINFLKGVAAEELPSKEKLFLFVLLILSRGSIRDITRYYPGCHNESINSLQEDYPYCGIDSSSERFKSIELPIKDIIDVFGIRIDALAKAADFSNKYLFISSLADILVANKRFDRACSLVANAIPRSERGKWLLENESSLFSLDALIPSAALFSTIRGQRSAEGAQLKAGHTWRLICLDSVQEALALSRLALKAPYTTDCTRALIALAFTRYGTADERDYAAGVLASLLSLDYTDPLCATEKLFKSVPPQGLPTWKILAAVQLDLVRNIPLTQNAIREFKDYGPCDEARAIASSWIFEAKQLNLQEEEGLLEWFYDYLQQPQDYCTISDTVRAFIADVLANVPRPQINGYRLASNVIKHLDDTQKRLKQIQTFFYTIAESQTVVATNEASLRIPPDPQQTGNSMRIGTSSSIPILQVHLFGRFEVNIGEAVVSSTYFQRQKVKTLLALLVLEAGNEIHRNRLIEALWPNSLPSSSRRNFYTNWSILKRALELPDKTCPYLVRMQNGYMLDKRLLTSDAQHIDDLCKKLTFGEPNALLWSDMLADLQETYSGELLPSEDANAMIIRTRNEYKTRVCDALISASLRLIECGETQMGLYFARTALQEDDTREDAYTTLMKAQLSAGQRTSALNTYFECKRFLADDLGLDPSPETTRLYRSIIRTEETPDE